MAADAGHRLTGLHVVTVGDVLLDVVVVASTPLVADDDVPAQIRIEPGGQAANVAAWAASLGARSTVIGPASVTVVGRLVAEHLDRAGVQLIGIDVAHVGTVVSVVAGGHRTLASDAGDLDWPQRLDPRLLPDDVDWLHVSGYALFRGEGAAVLLGLVGRARDLGAQISVDLSSATLIGEYGDQAARELLLDAIRPDLVFGTATEWQALGLDAEAAPFAVVRKDGAAGVDVLANPRTEHHPAPQVEVVDATGAGDAFAAGYLVGGIATALEATTRCLTHPGAFPR